MARCFNFSAGPAILPEEVLREAQGDLLDYKGVGYSIMECSHRGKEFQPVIDEAQANILKLMGLSADQYAVLFLTGGASFQFAQVPLNLLLPGQTADYINTGTWAAKAIKEAKLVGSVNVAADTSKSRPSTLPTQADLKLTPGAAYVHMTTNETIEGTQFKTIPQVEAPLVADMSSDIFSRPLDFSKFGLVYAGAQKNIGPAGVTLVVVRKDLAARASDKLSLILRYRTHIEEGSMYNTPPCFPIYLVLLVTRWIEQQGGLAVLAQRNVEKAARLYAAIDASGGYYRGTADARFRSDMNVTFRLPDEAREEKFCKEASARGLKQLKGHRSVGGIRASIYNAFPAAGVDALTAFMKDFQAANG